MDRTVTKGEFMRHFGLWAYLVLAVPACLPGTVVNEGPELEHFTVTPTFLCDNSSCIVHVSYQIDAVGEVFSELGVTGPDGVYSVLSTAPLNYEIFIAGDDLSIWTAGPGRYVFSLRVGGGNIGNFGDEATLEREVIRFEDTYSLPHSVAVSIDLPLQHSVTDRVEVGAIAVNTDKAGRSYQVCRKGPVLLGISYDAPLTVSPPNGEYPTELGITGRRNNGDTVFTFDSVRPQEIQEFMPPVALSEPLIIETVAESGLNPFPSEATVRWRLGFVLGCRLEE